VIRYRLGDAEAARRARWASVVRAGTVLAPIVLAIVLLHRLGWAPTLAFWAVASVLVALVATRAVLGYASTRRKLRTLVVTVSDEDIHVENARDGYSIPRSRVERIVEIAGSLGGLRVESLRDPGSGVVFEAHVPRGGDGYADVRGRLESWRSIERRGRRGPAMRVAMGAAVVAAIFFVPFLLEDFVARSKLVAVVLVAGMWLVMRGMTRGR
jgi:hypothetical protein